ncbi:putative Sialin [Hypsibius exemplaris]|uniref:Sialin n=1 Tax=Hypsibius exemplaris TaxID=2072580 RepID=A0A1W0WC64_HYPEX|nr:putative Sialin [Hypsibius exemplaris]
MDNPHMVLAGELSTVKLLTWELLVRTREQLVRIGEQLVRIGERLVRIGERWFELRNGWFELGNGWFDKGLEGAFPPQLAHHSGGARQRHALMDQSRKYDWDAKTQGLLHGAFFYGHLVSQIPGGWVAHEIGAKIPMAASMIIIGILTIISPFAADGVVWAFFIVRLLVGFFQGVVYPSITVLWSEWAPPMERGRLLSVSYSGLQLGTVMGMFLAGFLAQTYGWESNFYCFDS